MDNNTTPVNTSFSMPIRKFDTGATRDSNTDKLEYRRFFSMHALRRYAQYMHFHRKQADGNLRDPDNWKKGIPKDVYADSLYRHNQELAYGLETNGWADSEEDILCAIIFNAMGMLHEVVKARENR